MAEAGGHLWISQADSDWWAAGRVFDAAQPRSYAQTIAKFQQTVEKSIKAIAAALRDRFLVSIPIGYSHPVGKIASTLRRPAPPTDPTDIQHHINRLITKHLLNEIKDIDALAPRRPAPGALHGAIQNIHSSESQVIGLPRLVGTFSINEVNRFRALADRIYRNAREIVSALRR